MHIFYLIALTLFASLWGKEPFPSVLYLTWQHDPTSTMMIHWHTPQDARAQVTYRPFGQKKWEQQEGMSVHLPDTRVRVHTVELVDLIPDTEYEFRIDEQIYRFRTLPATLSRTVRFVVGGDAYFNLDAFRRMNAQIAALNPEFVIVGGDIAYTCGISSWFMNPRSPMQRWHVFFREWKKNLVTRDGRLIPLLPVVGNHDVRGSSLDKPQECHLFYELFAFTRPGIAFRTIDAGDYLSLFLLDTEHSSPVGGMQANWLKTALAERENRTYKIAAYHIGAYPSCYAYDGEIPRKIRQLWSPLFERYHLSVAFEHHNHAYKRTYPIKKQRIDPDGVVYMGDGSWGVSSRKTKDMWYLSQRKSINAACLVTLSPEVAEIETISIDGDTIDSLSIQPTASRTAFN